MWVRILLCAFLFVQFCQADSSYTISQSDMTVLNQTISELSQINNSLQQNLEQLQQASRESQQDLEIAKQQLESSQKLIEEQKGELKALQEKTQKLGKELIISQEDLQKVQDLLQSALNRQAEQELLYEKLKNSYKEQLQAQQAQAFWRLITVGAISFGAGMFIGIIF